MALFIVLWLSVLTANATINSKYNGIFLKGTEVAGVDIGNLDFEQAKEKINQRIDFISRRGFVYNTPDKTVVIYPNVPAIESADTSYPLVYWEIDKTLGAIEKKQSNNHLSNLISKIKTLSNGSNFELQYSWDQKQHLEILISNLKGLLMDKAEASFEIIDNSLKVVPEQIGLTFDYHRAMDDTAEQIKNLINKDINLQTVEDQPVITAALINSKKQEILYFIQKGDFQLSFEGKNWEVPNEIWRTWLKVKMGVNGSYVGLDLPLFEKYLETAEIKNEVEVSVQDARFKLVDGRVDEFTNSQDGRVINIENTLYLLEQALNQVDRSKVDLAVDVIGAKVKNQDVNNLGIKEIIGIGHSNFQYSPPNRVHNIGIGGDTLNGLLIAPDQEFSLVTALGEIDGEHGYKQELVIKGNETVPEYGGGLCQIGTTMFRGALSTGLPIIERRNHSYRVSYYEPAGTDATIYNPWPDFKFLNDTGHYILLQTRIEDNDLYFDFWGVKDGRTATTTYPVIYNIVKPEPTKIIETTDLAPGEKKCTESAHNGADAYFDYTVVYPEGSTTTPLHERRFSSHYTPWQAVCLVGAATSTSPTANATSSESVASSTDSN